MGMSAEAWTEALLALLPRGAVWPRDRDSALARLVAGFAEGMARTEADFERLIDEADWRTTSRMLPDWERVAGLPDPCFGDVNPTLQERRRFLVAKMTMQGGQSKAFFVGLAAALGYTITITEFTPFRCGGSRCGDPLGSQALWTWWRVHLAATPVWKFKAGASCCGERLGTWSLGVIECLFNRLKPAHTTLLFSYG